MRTKLAYLSTFTLSVLGLCSFSAVNVAYATTLFPVERTCPVGGEQYQSVEVGSTSQFGVRLDLRPLGPAAYLPWTECPNGFVVFKDEATFTEEEIAMLTPVVASAEYQRMRAEHMTAYRAVYLRRSLGESSADLAWLILRAAWEAEDLATEDQAMEGLRQAYLEEAYDAFIARAETRVTHDDEWWSALLLAAEIERQRYHFNESLELLEALPVAELASDDIKHQVIAQIRAHATEANAEPTAYEGN